LDIFIREWMKTCSSRPPITIKAVTAAAVAIEASLGTVSTGAKHRRRFTMAPLAPVTWLLGMPSLERNWEKTWDYMRRHGGSWLDRCVSVSRCPRDLRLCRLAQEQEMAALCGSNCSCIRKGASINYTRPSNCLESYGHHRSRPAKYN